MKHILGVLAVLTTAAVASAQQTLQVTVDAQGNFAEQPEIRNLNPNREISLTVSLTAPFTSVTFRDSDGRETPLERDSAGRFNHLIPQSPNGITFALTANTANGVTPTKTYSIQGAGGAPRTPSSAYTQYLDGPGSDWSDDFNEPYDVDNDEVNLFYTEFGLLANRLPVNVDQDDIFNIHLLVKAAEKESYSIKVIKGDYQAVELSIAPHAVPFVIIPQFGVEAEEYELITFTYGPFTTEFFEFQIQKKTGTNPSEDLAPATRVRINKLYQVGIGVSLINTNLSSPNFRVAPLSSGGNTIVADDAGNRTLLTLNVVWYWTIFHNFQGSIITKGRDILKEEPGLSLKRVFPTVGVSIDQDISENFFFGGVYEFARGGSICVGWHYGKIEKLADPNFVLAETSFTGSTSDIQKVDFWDRGFFFGVTLDTRIFNLLSPANKK